ncbi:MAG: ABC transporter ATP-binding protein, partial [Candidatus Bipolaricaulota bacterium]
MEPTVRTENLTKTFHSRKQGRINAIDKLSLDCFPSEIYGLLGPNGAGKTTTLRILATLLSPTQGKARVLDYDVSRSASEVRACVGFLATETGLYEGLTPVETLNFFGQINGLRGTELEQRRQTVLDILDMGEFADRRVAKLSTGMKQKLSLARSIIHDPPVLIFDEPTYGLDVMTAKTVLDYIESFRKQDKTIIISTHLMNIAEKLCD